MAPAPVTVQCVLSHIYSPSNDSGISSMRSLAHGCVTDPRRCVVAETAGCTCSCPGSPGLGVRPAQAPDCLRAATGYMKVRLSRLRQPAAAMARHDILVGVTCTCMYDAGIIWVRRCAADLLKPWAGPVRLRLHQRIARGCHQAMPGFGNMSIIQRQVARPYSLEIVLVPQKPGVRCRKTAYCTPFYHSLYWEIITCHDAHDCNRRDSFL